MPSSPIHSIHEAAGARFTDFGGWNMPVQYRGVLEEHACVREAVGVFDVSHLGRFEVNGEGAVDLVRRQLCNDIAKVSPGRAQYTMALNERGGIEDDIIVWYLTDRRLWVMPNGTNSDEIVARFAKDAPEGVTISDVRERTALLAVQGPDAPAQLAEVLGAVPGRFRVVESAVGDIQVVAAGTGYTGERGVEICMDAGSAEAVWDAVLAAGATPCGLGARDTLRLEMGFPLWGQDLAEDTTPLEAGLGWVIGWDHDFVGKEALEAQKADGIGKRLIAFTTEGRAIPRHGYRVTTSVGNGSVTSGNFSPTLGHGIGLAYVSPPIEAGATVTVEIRNKPVEAMVVDLPFLER